MPIKFAIDYSNSKFLTTSQTATDPNRLNWRAELLLKRNKNLIKGKRILDIASHDARFSYACLKLGASHVTGVEARVELVENSIANLQEFDSTAFNFIQGDIFEVFKTFDPSQFDTILCFGFLYHTLRQLEFFSELKRLSPKAVIIDTSVSKVPPIFKMLRQLRGTNLFNDLMGIVGESTPPARRCLALLNGQYFVFNTEGNQHESLTIDDLGIVAVPSEKMIETLFKVYGFTSQKINWNIPGIDDWTGLKDYKRGDRVSYIGQVTH